MVVAAEKREETNAQRRKEAEHRKSNARKFEAWSEKTEAQERKVLRREKKDRKKDWEAKEEKRLLEEGGGLEGTPRAVLHRTKQSEQRSVEEVEVKKPIISASQSSDEDDESDLEEDYKEVKEAQRTKRVKPTGGMVGGGMFDDML